jgi:hypothetical protein
MFASWGTGMQPEDGQGYKSPRDKKKAWEEKNRNEIITIDDRATRMSLNESAPYEVMSQISKAPTSVIDREYTRLEEAIKEQIIARNIYERNIEDLQFAANHTDNLVFQNRNDNNA